MAASVNHLRRGTARDQYEDWAPTYDQDTARLGWVAPAELLAAAATHVPPVSWLSVVDLGVGTGQASRAYRDAGARVVGIDVSRAMLDEAAAKDARFHALVEHDLDDGLPCTVVRHADADLVLSSGALHFVRDLEAIVSACRDVLVPGGVLAFTFIPVQPRTFAEHTRMHAPADVLALLDRAGFTVLELREFVAYHEADQPVRYALVVARDTRTPVPWPEELQWIDRTACIDRNRLRQALNHEPWRAAPAPVPLPADAVTALRDALANDELDPRKFPWPPPCEASPSEHATCDVLAILPHPDDESIYAGGTLSGWSHAGARIELIVATAGAGGRGGSDLAPRRAAELITASATLGISALACLAWPDTGKYEDAARSRPLGVAKAITAWNLDEAIASLVREIRSRRPRVVLTLDPEVDPNLSLHAHHLALGWLVAVAFHVAADADYAPHLGAPWAVHEHRVMAPRTDAAHAERHEIDAAIKHAAVTAHQSQAYSTAKLLAALDDPSVAAYEWCRTVQRRTPVALPLVRVRRPSTTGSITTAAWRFDRDRVLRRARSRGALVEILARQAHTRERDASVEAALTRLANDDAVAVVTGQQVGLLGGPALTLAKAMSAVAWARRLTARGIPATPIFWMASQDHDLDEVRTALRLEAPSLALALDKGGAAVGRRTLGTGIELLLQEWQGSMPAHGSAALWSAIVQSHTEDATFAQAFARLLAHATRGLGLVILDPDDRALAALARDVVARELFGTERAAAPLARARARLAAAGKAEVVPTERDVLQLFWTDEQRVRRRLRLGPDGIEAGGRVLATADLMACLELTPERLTPAALLRPVVQDAIVPTIAYVAGPTEARYHAQTDELYAWANVPKPRVLPRGSMRAIAAADVERLASAGGLAGLEASAEPEVALGLAGLDAAAHDLYARLLALAEDVTAMRDGTAGARDAAAQRWQAIRTHAVPECIAGQWPHACDRVDAAVSHTDAGTRVFTQAHHALGKLRTALLREGRRHGSEVVAAWRRVASTPSPPERRMTTAEALLRFSDTLPHTLARAFTAEPDAEVLVQVPAAPTLVPAPIEPAIVRARGRYGVLALGGLGGSGRVACDVARGLGERGHHVVMLAAADLHWARDTDASLRHVHVPAPRVPTAADDGWIAPLADAIVAAVIEHRLEALSVHYAVGLAEAAVLARDRLARSGHALRICVTLHGSDVTVFGHQPDQRDRQRRALARVDDVTAVSQWLARRAREILGLEHAPRVVANAVDTELFFPDPTRARVPGGPVVLCHASNFRPIKRPLDSIEVLARVRRREHDARLVMIGDGALRPEAEALADRRGLAPRITFVGPVAPAVLAGHLRTSDIVLVTSESESFSLVALEAMASGAVLVGTRCGGLEELLARASGPGEPDWTELLLAEPGDLDGLADRVTRLLDEPTLLARARATGSSICRMGFAQHEQLAAYATALRGDARG